MTQGIVDLMDLPPDKFLRWWFVHGDRHGLGEDYRSLYGHYFERPDQIPYVWNHYRERLAEFARLVGPGKHVLDVGCGLGTEVLWASLRDAQTVGLELHRWSLEIARKRLAILNEMTDRLLNCDLRYQNLLEVPDSETYDIILCREAFHHIEPRLGAVEKLARLLKPRGVLLIEETNGWNPLIQFKYLWIRGMRTVVTKRDPETGRTYLFGNERITTAWTLTRLFRPHGIEGTPKYFRFLPTTVARLTPIVRFTEAVEPWIQNLLPFRPLCLHYSWHGVKRG